MATPRTDSAHKHAVQFYGDDAELFETVGAFLSEGLVGGQPAIVIATPEHGIAIELALAKHLCGYSIGNFYKHNDNYQEICNLHSYVHPHGAVA